MRAKSGKKPILLDNGNGQSPAAEAFRVLGASTLAVMAEAHLKTIVFSSAEPGVGKSTAVANLAVVMAEAGRQVIVVDGDLRRPCLHQFFGVAQEPGLSDLLLDPGRLDLAVQPTLIKDVSVIAAGSAQSAAAEHLNAPVIVKLMSRLANKADIVLWDSPPLLSAADAALLAPLADGVVFIVERAQTPQAAVQAACPHRLYAVALL
jgi:capsular exopolysaccharide synthesis family protein